MNILPLIMALVLMLSVLTVEKLEKFKNQSIVQKEYQAFLKMSERKVFNKRQEKLYKKSDKDIKQLSFRFFVDKKARERDLDAAKQYRMLNLKLMKNLYGEAAFFKKLEQKRSNFLEELAVAIEQAADEAPKNSITQLKDIARLDLGDSELQEVFYHMLKGTVQRGELLVENDQSKKSRKNEENITQEMREKSYVSLFTFINYKGKGETQKIEIQKAPREILKVLFDKDDVVEAIIAKRQILAKSKDNGASDTFKNEFRNQISGIDDKLLDFKITSSNKEPYN